MEHIQIIVFLLFSISSLANSTNSKLKPVSEYYEISAKNLVSNHLNGMNSCSMNVDDD